MWRYKLPKRNQFPKIVLKKLKSSCLAAATWQFCSASMSCRLVFLVQDYIFNVFINRDRFLIQVNHINILIFSIKSCLTPVIKLCVMTSYVCTGNRLKRYRCRMNNLPRNSENSQINDTVFADMARYGSCLALGSWLSVVIALDFSVYNSKYAK